MKRKINILIIGFLLVVFYSSCTLSAKDKIKLNDLTQSNFNDEQNKNDSTSADTILNRFYERIKVLKEVEDKQKEILKKTNNKNGIDFFVKKQPTSEDPYYWIQVGFLNSVRLEVFYNFYAYPDNNKLEFLDTINDTILEIKPNNFSLPHIK